MAHEEYHGKSPAELADRVWELAKKLQFALYTTFDGKRMSQWPLTANAERDEHAFTFLVGQDDEKYGHLGQYPAVVLGFADASSNKYVVVNGTAEISNDRAKIKELWSPFAKAWWDSENDPDIRVLTVRPEHAELWDSPNKLVASAIMLTAAVTGTKPAVGNHGDVRL